MYNLVDYGNMLTDQVRVQSYRRAIEETVPGKRVLEIGGGTGFFACLASALNASHVTSVETSPLITKGATLAKANGLRNLTFVHGSSQHLRCDEPYDVIIHDLRGNTPFFADSMATLRDARRLLKKGGTFLPRRDRVFAALVEDRKAYSAMEGLWGNHVAGLDLTALRSATHRRMRYAPSEEASHWEPLLIADIKYSNPAQDEAETICEFTAGHTGLSHGVALWFDTELTANVGYTTNPWAPAENKGTTYGVVFLPWAQPVRISQGTEYRLKVELDSQGQARCQLFQSLVGNWMLLGSFVEKPAEKSDVELPSHYSFVSHPLLTAFRVALQELEKGHRVPTAIKKITSSCENIDSDEAAYKILSKCVELTRVQAKRGKERTQHLRFRHHRVLLSTNSRELMDLSLDALAPVWKRTTNRGLENVKIKVLDIYTTKGRAYRIEVNGSSSSFASLDKALDQLKLLCLHFGILASKEYVYLSARYTIEKKKAHLFLDDSAPESVCLLTREMRLISYPTTPEDNTKPGTSVPVASIKAKNEVSQAIIVQLLIQRCRNIDLIGNPVDYFAKLSKLGDD